MEVAAEEALVAYHRSLAVILRRKQVFNGMQVFSVNRNGNITGEKETGFLSGRYFL